MAEKTVGMRAVPIKRSWQRSCWDRRVAALALASDGRRSIPRSHTNQYPDKLSKRWGRTYTDSVRTPRCMQLTPREEGPLRSGWPHAILVCRFRSFVRPGEHTRSKRMPASQQAPKRKKPPIYHATGTHLVATDAVVLPEGPVAFHHRPPTLRGDDRIKPPGESDVALHLHRRERGVQSLHVVRTWGEGIMSSSIRPKTRIWNLIRRVWAPVEGFWPLYQTVCGLG